MSTFSDIKERVQTLIPSLTNDSNASIWTRLCQVFAGVIDATNLNCANSERVIENSARTLRLAGRQYYVAAALEYQEGDDLVLVDPATYRYGYAEVDTSKQIVKQVALIYNSATRFITMSVATIDADGQVTPLTETQLAAFASYIEFRTPLGLALEVVSNTPSVVDATMLTIRYDDAFSLDNIKTQVQQVMINQQAIIRGSSPLYVNDIEAAFRSINGVVDAFFTNPYTYESSSPSQTTPASKGILKSQTGYFNFSQGLQELSPSQVEFVISL